MHFLAGLFSPATFFGHDVRIFEPGLRTQRKMRLDLIEAAIKVRSLSHGQRVGVSGYGLSQEMWPLTRFAEFIIGRRFAPTRWQIDLSPTGRGELPR